MSGIYIPSMKIPMGNEVIYIFSDGTAQKAVLAMRETLETGKAIPVPDHGRLIDADVIISEWTNEGVYYSHDAAIICDTVDAAPTIIPADLGKDINVPGKEASDG